MKKRILFLLLFLLVAGISSNRAEAKSYKQGNFLFEYKVEWDGAWITKITPLSKKGIETLNIPKSLGGKKVVKLGSTKDVLGDSDSPDDNDNIFGVYNSKDDDSIQPQNLQEKVKKIKTIRIPSSVMYITQSCFLNLQDGKNINIPAALAREGLDSEGNTIELSVINQFTRTKWNRITSSPKNKKFKVKDGCLLSRGGKVLYGFVQRKDKIVIPGTVKRIAWAGDFSGCSTIVIPKGVDRIDKNTFASSVLKAVVQVAKGNKHYAEKDGSVYSKKSGRLVLAYVKNGVLKIPKGVTKLDGYDFIDFKGKLKKIIIPSGVKEIMSFPWDNWEIRHKFAKQMVCEIYCKTPPAVDKQTTSFLDSLTVYVPKDCKKKYIKAWKSAPQNMFKERN